MADAGNDLRYFFARHVPEAGQAHESGVDVEVDEVPWFASIEEHPAIGISIQHAVEKGTVMFFALPQPRFYFLARHEEEAHICKEREPETRYKEPAVKPPGIEDRELLGGESQGLNEPGEKDQTGHKKGKAGQPGRTPL